MNTRSESFVPSTPTAQQRHESMKKGNRNVLNINLNFHNYKMYGISLTLSQNQCSSNVGCFRAFFLNYGFNENALCGYLLEDGTSA